MQAIQTAVAAFCLACICAELVELFAGFGTTRRCIKAAAGLYILVVLLQSIPEFRNELRRVELPAQAPVSLPSTESAILLQTERDLEQKLEAACESRFGLVVRLKITLEQSDQQISASQVTMVIPPGVNVSAQEKAAAYLFEELGTEPILKTGEDVS